MHGDTLQIIFILAASYLVSRLMIKAKLPEAAVFWLIGRENHHVSTILFYFIGITTFLGIFIHHAIVVLTLLPLLKVIRDTLDKAHPDQVTRIATMLACCLMYGANIGGIGAITSSAANGILLTVALVNNVVGHEKLTFALWMLWAVPLVLVYTLAAWALIVGFFRPGKYFKEKLRFQPTESLENPYKKMAIWLSVLTFSSAFLISMLSNILPQYVMLLTIITAVVNSGVIIFLFTHRVKDGAETKPLLTFADCLSNMPKKGLVLVAVSTVVAGAFVFGQHYFEDTLKDYASHIVPAGMSPLLLCFIIALIATFATELASNTVVQLALFAIVPIVAGLTDLPPLLAMIAVTLASSSAFMSPLSTGVNSLVFGEVRDASLKKMIQIGFFMNLIGSFLVAFWILTVTRWILGL
jgi:sodium-dependent dicarboxylate transporter 2/3/5